MKNSFNYIAFYTILRKEIVRFMRIWMQTILPSVVTTGLYFMIFGKLIGQRVGEMGGFSYSEYIAPGLIMLSVITNTYANVSSSFFSNKFQKSIEEMLIAPVPNYLILWGYVAGGIARGFIVGFVVSCVALFFTQLQVAHFFVMILVVLLTSILFSLAGFFNALFAKRFDDISLIPTFVLTPLTYLGGVFYSITLLPPHWQKVSLLNPILYMVNAFRYGILGVSDISISFALLIICIFIVGFYLINIALLKKGTGLRN